jgi:hypothetical protein
VISWLSAELATPRAPRIRHRQSLAEMDRMSADRDKRARRCRRRPALAFAAAPRPASLLTAHRNQIVDVAARRRNYIRASPQLLALLSDPGSGSPEYDFTNRNTTFMTWNLLHLARMIKSAGGIPAHGNQRSAWDAGCRFDYPNPDYR